MTDPRFSIIPAAAVTDPRLEGRDLQVLCLFGRHIDRNGWCRRSQVKMAGELGCARSTLQASIERLVEAGWLIKRSDKEDVHAPGERSSAFEYRVMLDTPDVVSTGADLSAGGADLERQGVPTYASAPMLTTPLNEKKERERELDPTDGLALVGGKVRLHVDDPVFREIARMQGKGPPTDRHGFWTFAPDLVAKARANLEPKPQAHAA